MDITPTASPGRQIIEAYDETGFRIAGVRHSGAILVRPDQAIGWAVTGVGDMTLDSLAFLLDAEPRIEILLVGSGARFQMAPRALRDAIRRRGTALESMDTGAACRTYNVLLTEERRVGAALLPAESA